jgi:hypothetical protein
MSDNEMIDRVAKAIWVLRNSTPEQQAIAAIKAMGEPTQAMRSVGADIAGNSEDGAGIIWKAMSEAALSQT